MIEQHNLFNWMLDHLILENPIIVIDGLTTLNGTYDMVFQLPVQHAYPLHLLD
jgi:hypothetical protein